MLVAGLTVVCLALCAIWPWWADLTDARLGRGSPIGPTCRTCRRKPGHLDHAREDVLQRTCEGGLLRAIASMSEACAQVEGECRCPGGHADPVDYMNEQMLADLVIHHVDQRRLPWLIGPLVRRFPNNDVAGFVLIFGLPFLLGAIAGPLLLALAIW